MESFNELIEIVKTLRGPKGCPWDKEQTHASLTKYAIEEAHELEEAIINQDTENLKEELGDLLFQSMLHAQIASEAGQFSIDDVIQHLNHKMTTRHPHVFGDAVSTSSQQVVAQWDDLKAQEKNGASKQSLEDVPKSFPSLLRAHKIGKRTAKVDFDWDNPCDVFKKVQEEMDELTEAFENWQNVESSKRGTFIAPIEEEMGDLLFSISQLARHLDLDAETSLRKGNLKFISRFQKMLDLSKNFSEMTPQEKEGAWERAKKLESSKPS